MQVFDASSMIYAWDNYPIRQFPGLWAWMATQIDASIIAIPKVALEEVSKKAPDCGEWLRNHEIGVLGITNDIVVDAMRIKRLLGIADDNYRPNGVGENDLLIIATAKAQNAELISDERNQPEAPKVPANKKIPAVCRMLEVAVPVVNFLEYIKRSDAVFR